MATLAEHPTVRAHRKGTRRGTEPPSARLEADRLRRLVLEAGADDAGFVSIDSPEVADQRDEIVGLFPGARTLISFVCRTNRGNIRSPARSIANLEFHEAGDQVNEVAREVVRRLEEQGIEAANAGAMGFPMEMDHWPEKMWVVSHKPVAVAAGLGRMGIHRNVIHPRFGNIVLLGTVVTAAEVDRHGAPLDYNPCLECKLCVAACPTGAIGSDGRFDFSACYTHNYREFMGGFSDWVESLADSGSARGYRSRVSDPETVSMWQSLGFGPNYKAAYCMSVCPAGEEVIGPFLDDRKSFLAGIVKPLQQKEETVYVLDGSDAQQHVKRRFPKKSTKVVGNGLRPRTLAGFLRGLPLVFQPGAAADLEAVYHFRFTGEEALEATVRIEQGRLEVARGLAGQCDLRITADGETWLRFLAKDVSLPRALLSTRIRLWGDPRRLLDFARCFPS